MADVRSRLIELADLHGLPELRGLAEETKRRPRVRQAAPRSRPMTPELRAEIRRYAAGHPRATQAEIAAALHVNPGRVSETLGGKRE
jgi:hypothetical protein